MGNRNSGRKPKPYALKVLQGNPGKRKLVDDEPKPPTGPVEQPDCLSKMARDVWSRIAPICLHMGTLTSADVPAFAKLCELEATAIEASRQKDAPEFAMFTLSEDYNGAAKVGIHAAIRVERETAQALRPYYEYFGMTPSGRARLHTAKPEQAANPWAEALG